MVHIPVGVFVILFKPLPVCDSYYIASTQSLSVCPLIWGLAGIEMANLPAEKGVEERQDSRWFVLNMYHLHVLCLTSAVNSAKWDIRKKISDIRKLSYMYFRYIGLKDINKNWDLRRWIGDEADEKQPVKWRWKYGQAISLSLFPFQYHILVIFVRQATTVVCVK